MAYCKRNHLFETVFDIVAGDHGDLEMRYGPPIYLSGCWSVSCGYDYFERKMRRLNDISKLLHSDSCGLSNKNINFFANVKSRFIYGNSLLLQAPRHPVGREKSTEGAAKEQKGAL